MLQLSHFLVIGVEMISVLKMSFAFFNFKFIIVGLVISFAGCSFSVNFTYGNDTETGDFDYEEEMIDRSF